VTEALNQGTDTVQSAVDFTLGANVENLTLTGAALNGTGNGLANVLISNAGNNLLNGGAGADIMSGGLGNDTYVVDNTGDTVTEAVGEGIDVVQSSAAAFTLGANVDNLTLTGVGNINGTGNADNNVLTGNTGNNELDGGLGADSMSGGLGNDTYVVDNAGDAVIEGVNAGTDTVKSSVAFSLAALGNVENVTLTGVDDIDATGNALNNVLIGNAGVNTLMGGAGNDTLNGGEGDDELIGGLGNDTYVVDAAGDAVTEATHQGTDTVQSSVDFILGANVENLALTGTDDVDGTGNTLNNVLTGNGGANVLIGDAGNDTLIGGAGNDRLDGGLGNDSMSGGAGDDTYVVNSTLDVVSEAANAGIDTVESSQGHCDADVNFSY
jgi:trimeric autotransporter adhesin